MAVPLLTIAIPVYERKDYFVEALNSAINQTMPVDIIVVDNASSHTFFEDAVKAKALAHVKYYRNATNLGMYGNWNKCIEYCETEFVAILGDDDILKPNYATLFYEALQSYPSIKFFHCAFEKLLGNNGETIYEKYEAPIGYHTGKELIENALERKLNINTNGMIFSTSLYPRFSFLYTNWAYNQDYLFAYTAFAECVGFGCKECLFTLRVNPNGNAVMTGAKAYLSTSMVYKYIKEMSFFSDTTILRKAAMREKWVLRNAIISGNLHLVLEMINESNNPFGIHLKQLLLKDSLSRLAIDSTGLKKILIVYLMRLLRKIN